MNNLITSVLFCFLASASFAQIELGVKLGPNVSRVEVTEFFSVESDPESRNLYGMQVGISARKTINKWLSFRPELLFVTKGSTFYLPTPTQSRNTEVTAIQRVNYLELPVLLDFSLPLAQGKAIFIGLGLFGVVGVGGRTDYTLRSEDWNDPSDLYIENRSEKIIFDNLRQTDRYDGDAYRWWLFRRGDFGTTVSVGYRKRNMALEASYSRGLITIQPGEFIEKFSKNVRLSAIIYLDKKRLGILNNKE